MTIPNSTLWLAEIVKGKQQYINVGVQLHLKVIDDSLPKQGKANQGKGLFCTSSRTNEVPFIAHELVQHLPTAQCSFSKHEHDSPTRGDREVRGQFWCQSVDDCAFGKEKGLFYRGLFVTMCYHLKNNWYTSRWYWRSFFYILFDSIISSRGQPPYKCKIEIHLELIDCSVDDAGWFMMPVVWWCRSVDDARQLMMHVSWWYWLVEDDVQLMMLII